MTTRREMSKARNLKYIQDFVDGNQGTFTPSTLKLYASQLNTMADKFGFNQRQSTILKYMKSIENVNTKSNKLNAIILLRKYYNFKHDMLRDMFRLLCNHSSRNLSGLISTCPRTRFRWMARRCLPPSGPLTSLTPAASRTFQKQVLGTATDASTQR